MAMEKYVVWTVLLLVASTAASTKTSHNSSLEDDLSVDETRFDYPKYPKKYVLTRPTKHPLLTLIYPHQTHTPAPYLLYTPKSSIHQYTPNGLPIVVPPRAQPPPSPSPLPLPLPLHAHPHHHHHHHQHRRPPPVYPIPTAAAPSSCNINEPLACPSSRYRSYDGSCNNLREPSWGAANTRYSRLAPANYADNVHAPPVSQNGNPLPLAREVSFTLFPDVDIQDRIWTLVSMQWGQIMTHDMAMIAGSTQSKPHATECCSAEGQLIQSALSSPLCFPIIIPPNDPVYSYERQRCRNFVRSTTDLDRGCSSGLQPAEQLTTVSHFLDLSVVYGSDDETAARLRAGVGGRLVVDVRGNREWLPPADNRSAACDVSGQEVCYSAGDTRVNQNPQLTILHLILHREHNRIAGQLARLNPHWSDETIFQEARRIAIAEHQQISYYEWLPIFIGEDNAVERRVIYKPVGGWVSDYDPNVNPSTINEHSTAAFRYFHSLIAGRLLLVNEQRFAFAYNALRLSDHFNRPGVIEENGNLDQLTRGMAFQPQEESDQYFDREITNYLFRNNRRLGDDLRAIDIQRNRDHGLASYNDLRALAGLPRAREWNDFADVISPENIQKLAQLYESPDDVDLTVGGSLERHVQGTLAGPTFLNILSEQFYRTRAGDRYWFETGDPELAFTIEQLQELRKASIARLLCDNGDNIQLMQMRAFEQVSQSNPLVSCNQIPAIDLSLWKDIRTPTVQLPTWVRPTLSKWISKK
ncbi:peroxidase [Trichogramma pretiosum]|uniref:peroxidase n=1 Tax=Trichogramma pretiosum TaxID=7493 RepID=UPI0006C95796|nr:peroxidase [Trichogramma pretiosum]